MPIKVYNIWTIRTLNSNGIQTQKKKKMERYKEKKKKKMKKKILFKRPNNVNWCINLAITNETLNIWGKKTLYVNVLKLSVRWKHTKQQKQQPNKSTEKNKLIKLYFYFLFSPFGIDVPPSTLLRRSNFFRLVHICHFDVSLADIYTTAGKFGAPKYCKNTKFLYFG